MLSSCTRSEEALLGEACVASMQVEQELQEQLLQLAQLDVLCQPEENDQLDLMMETDALRKSVHNLGTIITTRYGGQLCLKPSCVYIMRAFVSSPSVQWRARVKRWGRGLKSAGLDIPPQ